MSKTVIVKIHSQAAEAILKSPEVLGDLERRARAIQLRAGGDPDFEVVSMVGSGRARASVVTATQEGRRAEAESRALTRAIDAGRL